MQNRTDLALELKEEKNIGSAIRNAQATIHLNLGKNLPNSLANPDQDCDPSVREIVWM